MGDIAPTTMANWLLVGSEREAGMAASDGQRLELEGEGC